MTNQERPTGATPWQEIEEGMGFKRLTPENWLEPDSVMRVFRYSAGEWVHDIVAIRLSEEVPLEIRKLFAAARGALCYGYFFYPLYALASEQLSRVAEAAVGRKYEAVGGTNPEKTSFKRKLDHLQREGLITGPDVVWWGAIRELRNAASHPQDHRPQDPGATRRRAEAVAEQVNRLFGGEQAATRS